jgi:hypothetical protein
MLDIFWNFFDEGCNFTFDLTLIKGMHKKLWASKVRGDSILGIVGLPTWNFGKNVIWV